MADSDETFANSTAELNDSYIWQLSYRCLLGYQINIQPWFHGQH